MPRPRRSTGKAARCTECGTSFTLPVQPGRPTLACSVGCRLDRRNRLDRELDAARRGPQTEADALARIEGMEQEVAQLAQRLPVLIGGRPAG